MSAPAVGGDTPTLRIRGTEYPVLLPTLRDPRLHLASIIITLQVLGQVAFDFQLSIAQILISLAVAGILEVAIAFRSHRVLMWPASALLTGNGVAFVLRVPGTEHGDWWSTKGWWIFAGTSAVALLSKYLIRVRGRHIFNPSNFGLVLCFLLLGAERADPLALWWGPLSPALVVALVLIVVGGFLILRRLHLVGIAVGFWLAFAAGIGVLAASGHTMTAAWHVGAIEGREFWWLLVTSPEILVFLFFMITDPKTIPSSPGGRRVYAVGVGLLATVLIAPQTTEFATKVAILGALFAVCAARGAIELSARSARLARRARARRPVGGCRARGALVYAGSSSRPASRRGRGGLGRRLAPACRRFRRSRSSTRRGRGDRRGHGADHRTGHDRRPPYRVGRAAGARLDGAASGGKRRLARVALGAHSRAPEGRSPRQYDVDARGVQPPPQRRPGTALRVARIEGTVVVSTKSGATSDVGRRRPRSRGRSCSSSRGGVPDQGVDGRRHGTTPRTGRPARGASAAHISEVASRSA